jgi:hypothetical protein
MDKFRTPDVPIAAHPDRVVAALLAWARRRGRPVENRWVGQQIRDPDPDLATLAGSLGLRGHGPVATADGLDRALSDAVMEAAGGVAVLVDVRVGGTVLAS